MIFSDNKLISLRFFRVTQYYSVAFSIASIALLKDVSSSVPLFSETKLCNPALAVNRIKFSNNSFDCLINFAL